MGYLGGKLSEAREVVFAHLTMYTSVDRTTRAAKWLWGVMALELLQLLGFVFARDLGWAPAGEWLAHAGSWAHAFVHTMSFGTLEALFWVSLCTVLAAVALFGLLAAWHTNDDVGARTLTVRCIRFSTLMVRVLFVPLVRFLLAGLQCMADADNELAACDGHVTQRRTHLGVGVPTAVLLTGMAAAHAMLFVEVRQSKASVSIQALWTTVDVWAIVAKAALCVSAALFTTLPGLRAAVVAVVTLALGTFTIATQPYLTLHVNDARAGVFLGTSLAAIASGAAIADGTPLSTAASVGTIVALLVGGTVGVAASRLRRWHLLRRHRDVLDLAATTPDHECVKFAHWWDADVLARLYVARELINRTAATVPAEMSPVGGSMASAPLSTEPGLTWQERQERVAVVKRLYLVAEVQYDGHPALVYVRMGKLMFLLTHCATFNTDILVTYRKCHEARRSVRWNVLFAWFVLMRERRRNLIATHGETSMEFQRDLARCRRAHESVRTELVSMWKLLLAQQGRDHLNERLTKVTQRVDEAINTASRRYTQLTRDYYNLPTALNTYGHFCEEIMSDPDRAADYYRLAERAERDELTEFSMSQASGSNTNSRSTGSVYSHTQSEDGMSRRSGRSGRSHHSHSNSNAGVPTISEVSVGSDGSEGSQRFDGSRLSTHSDRSREPRDDDARSRVTVRPDDSVSVRGGHDYTEVSRTSGSASTKRYREASEVMQNRRHRMRFAEVHAARRRSLYVRSGVAIACLVMVAIVTFSVSLSTYAKLEDEMTELRDVGDAADLLLLNLHELRLLHALAEEENVDEYMHHVHAANEKLEELQVILNELEYEFAHSTEVQRIFDDAHIPAIECFPLTDGTIDCHEEHIGLSMLLRKIVLRSREVLTMPMDEVAAEEFVISTPMRYVADNTGVFVVPTFARLAFLFDDSMRDSLEGDIVKQYVMYAVAMLVLVLLPLLLFQPALRGIERERVGSFRLYETIPKSAVSDVVDRLQANARNDRHYLRRVDNTKLVNKARKHTLRYAAALFVLCALLTSGFAVRVAEKREVSDVGKEMIYASLRTVDLYESSTLAGELNVLDTHLWDDLDHIRHNVTVALEEGLLFHNALLHGDSELGVSASRGRSAARRHLLFDEPISMTFVHEDNAPRTFIGVDSLIHSFAEEVVLFELHPEDYSWHSARYDLVQEMGELVRTQCGELMHFFQDEVNTVVDLMRTFEIVLLTGTLLVVFVSYWSVFHTLVQDVLEEESRTHLLLLLIPSKVVENVDELRSFFDGKSIEESINKENEKRGSVEAGGDLASASPDMHVVVNTLGVVTFANAALTELTGWGMEDVVGRHVNILLPEEHHERHMRSIKTFFERLEGDTSAIKMPRYIDVQCADGERKRFDTLTAVTTINNTPHVLLTLRLPSDEQCRAEACERQVNGLADAVITVGADGTVLAINRAGCEMFKRRDLVGKNVDEVLRHVEQGSYGEDSEVMMETTFYDLLRDNSEELVAVSKVNAKEIPLDVSSAEVLSADGTKELMVVLRDATEKLRAQLELEEARRMEETGNAKTAFLANMSHEIRTPLNGIIGMNQMILEEDELPQQAREYAEFVRTSADSLLVIINDILDISKMAANKMTLESMPLDLEAVVEEVMMSNMTKATEKGLSVVSSLLDTSGAAVEVVGDPTRLKQVINNLVSNAIKFTHSGSVTVAVTKMRETSTTLTMNFRVTDTGIGIARDKLDSLFERFSQADTSTTRKYGGTGLGLSISKQLVELMGGTISVTSQVNVGTTFSFEIPFDKPEQLTLQPHARLNARCNMVLLDESMAVLRALKAYVKIVLPLAQVHTVNTRVEATGVLDRHSIDVVIAPQENLDMVASGHWAPRVAFVSTRKFGAPIDVVDMPPHVRTQVVELVLPVRKRKFSTLLAQMLGGEEVSASSYDTPTSQTTSDTSDSSDDESASATSASASASASARGGRGGSGGSGGSGRGQGASTSGAPGAHRDAHHVVREALTPSSLLQVPGETGGRMRRRSSATSDDVPLSRGRRSQSLTPESDANIVDRPSPPTLDLKDNKVKVLVVEDQVINQKVLTAILRKAGYLYDVANNGQEGLDLWKDSPRGEYACILMDCQMPVMDGYTASRHIRTIEAEQGGHIPIIAITAHAMQGEKQKVLDAGIDIFQTKPYRKEQLIALISKVTRKYIGSLRRERSLSVASVDSLTASANIGDNQPVHVLMVTPERDVVAQLLSKVELQQGSSIHHVQNEQEAMQRLGRDFYHLMVVDMRLMNAIDFAEQSPLSRNHDIIVLGMVDDHDTGLYTHDLPVDLLKAWPSTVSELVDDLAQWCGQRLFPQVAGTPTSEASS